MSDTYETVDGSKIIPANDIAKYAEQLKRERDQWRECAEKLADASRNMLCGWRYLQAASGHMRVVGWEQAGNSVSKAIAEFDRLKEDSK